MEDKYYIIDYDYKNDDIHYFIRELVPIKDFTHFVRNIEYPKIELLGCDSWDGIYPHHGVLLKYIEINKGEGSLICDLDIIKGYYTNKDEAEKDLDKLINFIEKAKKKYIF